MGGHLFITDNTPGAYWFEFDQTYWGKPPFIHQSYMFIHGIDEDGIYAGNEDAGRFQPLNFANYFRANMYLNGPLKRPALVSMAKFAIHDKPLLVYMATVDDYSGPKWDSKDKSGYRPASALFA